MDSLLGRYQERLDDLSLLLPDLQSQLAALGVVNAGFSIEDLEFLQSLMLDDEIVGSALGLWQEAGLDEALFRSALDEILALDALPFEGDLSTAISGFGAAMESLRDSGEVAEPSVMLLVFLGLLVLLGRRGQSGFAFSARAAGAPNFERKAA